MSSTHVVYPSTSHLQRRLLLLTLVHQEKWSDFPQPRPANRWWSLPHVLHPVKPHLVFFPQHRHLCSYPFFMLGYLLVVDVWQPWSFCNSKLATISTGSICWCPKSFSLKGTGSAASDAFGLHDSRWRFFFYASFIWIDFGSRDWYLLLSSSLGFHKQYSLQLRYGHRMMHCDFSAAVMVSI